MFLLVVIIREEVKEMMNKKKTGSETLAAFEEHLNEVTDHSSKRIHIE